MGGFPAFRRISEALTVLLLLAGFSAGQAQAFEAFDGRIQAHGYLETQLRTINANFSEDWDVTQWYTIFNLELEFDIAPDGVGPIDLLQAYIRAEVRYDCIYSRGCGMVRSINAFGDRSKSLPRRLNGGHDQLGSGAFARNVAVGSNGSLKGKDGDRGVPYLDPMTGEFQEPTNPDYGTDRRNGTRAFTGERLSGGSTDPVALNRVRGFSGLFTLPGADGLVGRPTEDCNPIDGARFESAPFGTSNCNVYAGGEGPIPAPGEIGPNSLFRLRGLPIPGFSADGIPNAGDFLGIGVDDPTAYVLANFEDFRFGQIDARGGSGNGRPTQVLGPWLPKNKVSPIAALADRVNPFDSTRSSPVLISSVFNNTFNKEYERRFSDNFQRIQAANPNRPAQENFEAARNRTLQQARQAASDSLLTRGFVPGTLQPLRAVNTGDRGVYYGRDAVNDALLDDPFISDDNLRRSVPFPTGAGGRDYRPIPYTDEGDFGVANDVARGLYYPTNGLKRAINSGDLEPSWLLNLDENNRAWNRGFSQKNEKELKEAYLDIEMLDSRLWLRIGRQQIVWGKTELFRTTDQFNPTDVGLASLPSLEESRIALWAFRSVYSLYEVGPLEDVRLEFAFNFDQVSPSDLGACGEPYVVNLVCSANFGAFAHGLTGIGVAGVDIPDAPWSGFRGWELGARIEFRWDRFSFAISDYWGYDDFPYLERISSFERNVDPTTGRPRAMASRNPCVYSDTAGSLVYDLPGEGPADPSRALTANRPARGRAVVGHDPGCLRPGVSDRTRTFGSPSTVNNVFRSSQERIAAVANPDSPLFINLFDPRRNPRQTTLNARFDPALVAVNEAGQALEFGTNEPLSLSDQTTPGDIPLFAFAEQVQPGNALDAHPANLQFFGFICTATVGFSSLDPTACAQTVFGSTALASEDSPGIGGVSRVLALVLGGAPGALLISYPLAGATLPVVSLSRDSDTPVQFFRGTLFDTPSLRGSRSAQEGIVINTYDTDGQRVGQNIVDINDGVLSTALKPFGRTEPSPLFAFNPYGPNPRPRDFFFEPDANGNFGGGVSPLLPGAVWLGAAETIVPFYASCTYNDFRGNLRNCDQDYKVGAGDPDTLNDRLSAQQEALLGCGPFWGTGCDEQGIDLLNMDASVLLQSFPGLDGTASRPGQGQFSSGGQWRTDGLEPGARVMTLNSDQAGRAFFNFSCANTNGDVCDNGQPNSEGFFEPIPLPGEFLLDNELIARGRPTRYAQPGTLPFVVQNATFNGAGERVDYTCTTSDIGGRDTDILPGCRSKWKDQVGRDDGQGNQVGTLNLFGIDLECRRAAQSAVANGGDLGDPRCIAGTPENVAIIQGLSHLSEIEKQALIARPRGGIFLGGDENFRADPRSWSISIDGDPDRLGFDGFGAYTGRTDRVRNEIVFRTPEIIFISPGAPAGTIQPNTANGAGHPFTGQPWANELAAFSWNFLSLLVASSGGYTNNLHDPDKPLATGLFGQAGNPLAFATYDPIDPENATFVANIRNIEAEIDALDAGDPAQLQQIRALEADARMEAAKTKPICSFITPQTCETVAAIMGIAGQKRNTIAAGGNGRFGRRTFVWHGGGEVVIKFNKRNVLGFGMDFAEDYTKSNWGVEATWIQGIPTGDPNEFDGNSKTDTFNLTLSMDRPTFINFLNPNRTFFITTQWFFQYRDGYHADMNFNGAWNVLGIVAINTGYFQDRLLPSLLAVYDVMSASGAIIPQVTYRFNENFSATVGIAGFWGRTERARMGINEIGPPGNRTNGSLQYNNTVPTGLALVRERDEVFMRLRYTF
jgi:hypothetical protein